MEKKILGFRGAFDCVHDFHSPFYQLNSMECPDGLMSKSISAELQ